jgi:hypothetical protein
MASSPGCDRRDADRAPAAAMSASAGPLGLTPELAKKVLAKVGDRTITLGDYAATVERMDPFERLRYQTPERRKLLLDEMIDLELLAQEARRQKLDERPETQERLRQLLRDEVLRELQTRMPTPESIPETEVRAYYEQHREEFRDPERRRVAHIVMNKGARAAEVLERAKAATPVEWGKLVQENSLEKPPPASVTAPLELAGDLGIVSDPNDAKSSDGAKVPLAVKRAVFAIPKLGGVHESLVEVGSRVHIVRLAGKSEARTRSYVEAERPIRVAIVQQRLRDAEERLHRELMTRFPVAVNDAALETVKVPSAGSDGK